MSLFKSKAIVLKKTFSGENREDIFLVFSLEYGKIQVIKKTSKKEKNLDIGYIVNFEIETSNKSDVNKIKSIKIINQFDYTTKDFKTINLFMELINLISKNTPIGLTNSSLYEILEFIIKSEKTDYQKLILTKLKILSIFGILNIENKDPIIVKILNFIDKNSIDKIFLLTGINQTLLSKLETQYKL